MKNKDVIALYVERKKDAILEKVDSELPNLTIYDEEMAIVLGQWLGEIPINSEEIKKNDVHSRYLTPSYLLRKKLVTENDLNIVIERFARILKMIGISEDNICFFDNFKRNELKELTFDCYLYNTGEVINMKIYFMTYVNPPELIVSRNGVSTEYEHWYCKHDEPDRLGLQAVSKLLDENRKIFYYTTHREYHIELTDDGNKLEIDIEYPQVYESTDLDNPFVDYLMLEKIISQVTFPIDFKLLSLNVEQCLKMNVRKYDINFNSHYNDETITYSYPERVMVGQDDKELALRLGDWMEASRYHYLQVQESTIETRKNILTNKGMKDISRHFTEILKLAGLDVNSMCLLTNFDKDTLSFDCVLDNGDVAHINLIMGTEEDSGYKLSVQYDDTIKLFTYHKGYEDEDKVVPDSLFLKTIEKKTDWDRTFKREYDTYCYKAEIIEDDDKIEVEIYYPGDLDDTYPNNPFIDEEKMDTLISKADLPIEITRLYDDICKCFKMNVLGYSINIKGTKKENGKDVVKGALRCCGTNFYEFTITKRWRTITVKSDGTWIFDSEDWKVSQNAQKKINYTLCDIISDESRIDECPSPSAVYKEAKEEAELVRKLAKALVQPKNK